MDATQTESLAALLSERLRALTIRKEKRCRGEMRTVKLAPEVSVADGRIHVSISNDIWGFSEKEAIELTKAARAAAKAELEVAGVTGLRPVKRNGATILRGGYQNMGSFNTARFTFAWILR